MGPAAPVPHVCPRYRLGRGRGRSFGRVVGALFMALALVVQSAALMPLGAHAAAVRGAAGQAAGAVYKVGSFAKINTTGNQTVAHGLGVTPKAIIFWTSGATGASGSWTGTIYQVVGFTAGSSNSYAVNGYSQDALGTSFTRRRMAAKAITFVDNGGTPGVWAEADLSSWDATNFVLNWTTNTNLGAMNINFVAIGGAGVQAKVVNWTTPTVTGNHPVTGVGFQPDLVLHASTLQAALGSGTYHLFGLGAMNSAGEQWANTVASEDAGAAANTARGQRTDSAIYHVQVDGTNIYHRASYSSMNPDGFIVNFATAYTSTLLMFSLCLKGVTSKVGSFNKTTAAAPASQSVSAGFRPKAVLLSSFATLASTTPIDTAVFALGAYDGTNQRTAGQFDWDTRDPTEADSIFYNNKVLVMPYIGPSAVALAEATALTATGFDLNWTTNDANARQALYLALA